MTDKEMEQQLDDEEAEAQYDRWRDDCATELCGAVDRLVGEVTRDKKSYFENRPDEAIRVIFIHSQARQAKLDEKRRPCAME